MMKILFTEQFLKRQLVRSAIQIAVKNNISNLEHTQYHTRNKLTFPVPIPDKERKLSSISIFTLYCGASNGLMKAFKSFIRPFEAPQSSVKIKILVNFYSNTTL